MSRLAIALIALSATGCGTPPALPELIAIDRRAHPHHGIVSIRDDGTAPLFQAEPFGHVMQLDVAERTGRCAFSYVAPPVPTASGTAPRPGSSLYGFSLQHPESPGNLDKQLLLEAGPDEYLLDPSFAPDGGTLYFVRVRREASGGNAVTLEQLELTDGNTTVLAADGIWPEPSPDGSNVVFVTVDPATGARGLARLDRQNGRVRTLVEPGVYPDLDTPVYSPDGQWVYVFVASPVPAPATSLLERLTGLGRAYAHSNVPGTWWRVPAAGGSAIQVTAERELISHGDALTDGAIVYSSSLGLRLLGTDGVVRTLESHPHYGALAIHGR